MNCEDYKRARSPKQKQERMQEIMDAVNEMFHEMTYHEITLTTISERLGMSRGNLYKYIDTREDIFMALYLQYQCRCMTEIKDTFFECGCKTEGELCPSGDFDKYECQYFIPKKISLDDFSKTLANIFARHIDLFKYYDILGCIIETNVCLEKLAEFRKNMECMRHPIYLAVKSICPHLDDKTINQFYNSMLCIGCGLYNQINMDPKLEKALEMAGIINEKIDFAEEMENYIKRGLQ